MASLLETLVTFMGVMLILALAAQSVQEIIKIVFAIKSQTALRGVRGVVVGAAKAGKLLESDGEAIFRSVFARLQGLGQNGVRKSAVRLDSLTAGDLGTLIESATQVLGSSLEPTGDAKSDDKLKEVAKKAQDWFTLAWEPVGDRYRRRMQGFAILSAAIVVVGLNVDAFAVLRKASADPAYRAAVTAAALHLDTLEQRSRTLKDSLAHGDTSAAVRQARAESLKTVTDSLNAARARAVGGQAGFVLGEPGAQRWTDIWWWVGIIASTLLVSLGAPFWHDMLEAVFGLKNRIRAEAASISARKPG